MLARPINCHAFGVRLVHVTYNLTFITKKCKKKAFSAYIQQKITKTSVNRCKLSVKCIKFVNRLSRMSLKMPSPDARIYL